jgi:hypothetical protein
MFYMLYNGKQVGVKFVACFMLVSCLAYYLTLKMDTICSSKSLVDFHQTMWHYIPDERAVYSHHYANLKSNIIQMSWTDIVRLVEKRLVSRVFM